MHQKAGGRHAASVKKRDTMWKATSGLYEPRITVKDLGSGMKTKSERFKIQQRKKGGRRNHNTEIGKERLMNQG